MILFYLISVNGWLAAVPPCVGFAGWLFGGMDSKPLFAELIYFEVIEDSNLISPLHERTQR
jgi:hypothetical protein